MVDAKLPVSEIRALAADARFVEAVGPVYAALDARVASRNPRCINRGACCRFDSFGHKLFVTPVELAYFLANRDVPAPGEIDAGSCPYHSQGLCTTRAGRPIGCRIFFCEVESQGWQPEESEATLREIKELHDRFSVPYIYVEWLAALCELEGRAPAD